MKYSGLGLKELEIQSYEGKDPWDSKGGAPWQRRRRRESKGSREGRWLGHPHHEIWDN